MLLLHQKTKAYNRTCCRQWNEADKEYWAKCGVTLQYLNLNFVYPVEQYYINRNVNPEPKYYYNALTLVMLMVQVKIDMVLTVLKIIFSFKR